MNKKVKEVFGDLVRTINRLVKNPIINEIFAIIYTLSGKYIGIFKKVEDFIKQKRWFMILMVLFASILLCFTIIAYTIC